MKGISERPPITNRRVLRSRDYHLGARSDSKLRLWKRPLREFARWNLRVLQVLLYRFVPSLYVAQRDRALARRNAFARPASPATASAYPPGYEYVEVQIGNETRPVAVIGQGESFTFTQDVGVADELLVGLAPILDEVASASITGWRCRITVDDGRAQKHYDVVMPYGDRSEEFAYFPGDGWVDLKCPLRDVAPATCRVTITCDATGSANSRVKPSFGIASPQVRTRRKQARNVVLITAESLTDISYLRRAYGFAELPNIDQLCADAVQYPIAYTPAPTTLSFAASLFTGLLPSQHAIGDYSHAATGFECDTFSRQLTTLSEAFKREGWVTGFSGTEVRFGPKNGWGRGFDVYYHVMEKWAPNVPQVDWLLHALDSLRGVDKFLYQHIDFLHDPLVSFHESSKTRFHDVRVLASAERRFERVYESQLQQLDFQLGLLVRYLKSIGEYESTAIILTGDHGCGISWKKHIADALYEERLRVPLVVKYPDWANVVEEPKPIVNSSVEIQRIAYALLGKRMPAYLQGLPQYEAAFGGYAFAESIMNPNRQSKKHSMAIMDGRYKFLCENEIDWRQCIVERELSDRLYKWDGNTYAETSDEAMAAQYRALAHTVIEKNLGFVARYPQEKY